MLGGMENTEGGGQERGRKGAEVQGQKGAPRVTICEKGETSFFSVWEDETGQGSYTRMRP